LDREISWDDAIQRVLEGADGALHYTDIAERIVSQGLRTAVGATPAATVASYLSTSLSKKSSPFLRTARGEYGLRQAPQAKPSTKAAVAIAPEDIAETGALRAFGMFWQRSNVLWGSSSRIFGRQGPETTKVDFAGQIGVYLLHDQARTVYVGRASDTLSARLRAHTVDRLSGRWDRFSWFGLRAVSEKGELMDSKVPWSQAVVIETMEALLIESLEPPLNRRRGDNFSAAEYQQFADPEIEVNQQRALLAKVAAKM